MIIPNGVYVDRLAAGRTSRPAADGATVVFLGRFDEPRKGLPVLLRALPRIRSGRPDVRLVVAGRGDADAWARRVPATCRDRVSFAGPVDPDKRARLLGGADLFVAPNLGGESFGVVVVEAMAAGAPVLTSDRSSLPEVGGDSAAYVDPTSVMSIRDGLAALLGDPDRRAHMAGSGRARAAEFSWERTARETLAVLTSRA